MSLSNSPPRLLSLRDLLTPHKNRRQVRFSSNVRYHKPAKPTCRGDRSSLSQGDDGCGEFGGFNGKEADDEEIDEEKVAEGSKFMSTSTTWYNKADLRSFSADVKRNVAAIQEGRLSRRVKRSGSDGSAANGGSSLVASACSNLEPGENDLRSNNSRTQRSNEDEEQYCARGLEHLRCRTVIVRHLLHKQSLIHAVLEEQERQRLAGTYHDPNLIRRACVEHRSEALSTESARSAAMADEAYVKRCVQAGSEFGNLGAQAWLHRTVGLREQRRVGKRNTILKDALELSKLAPAVETNEASIVPKTCEASLPPPDLSNENACTDLCSGVIVHLAQTQHRGNPVLGEPAGGGETSVATKGAVFEGSKKAAEAESSIARRLHPSSLSDNRPLGQVAPLSADIVNRNLDEEKDEEVTVPLSSTSNTNDKNLDWVDIMLCRISSKRCIVEDGERITGDN